MVHGDGDGFLGCQNGDFVSLMRVLSVRVTMCSSLSRRLQTNSFMSLCPTCANIEKVNTIQLLNYCSNEGDEEVVEYMRMKLKQGIERTINLPIQFLD